MNMKTILITGGAGFIGSNFVKYMLREHPDHRIITMDALTYAGNLGNLSDILKNPNHIFIEADIISKESVEKIFLSYDIDMVVNLAAESHVDRSIEGPRIFLTTNIVGTQTLLEVAKKYWKVSPEDKYCNKYKNGILAMSL